MTRVLKLARQTLLLSAAWTAGVQAAPTDEEWHFELTPYLWATRMNGEVQTDSLPATQVDMRFADILKSLDMGFMSAFEARKGRWTFLADEMYMKVSDSATASSPDGTVSVSAKAHVKQTMVAGAAAYRVTDDVAAVDVLGGLRYSRINAEANIDAALISAVGTINRSGARAWTEPYLGARVRYPISERLHAIVYGDIGGFGVGSDFTWQGMFGATYDYSSSLVLTFGYRYMDVDYDQEGFRYKMTNDGIYSGVGLRF